jgi:hypothetical protein
MIKMPCPYCGTRLKVPEAKVGKSRRCSACKETFVVPFPPVPKRRPVQPALDDDASLVIDSDDSSLVIEPDAGVALEIVDFLDNSAALNMQDARFRTEVVADSANVPRTVLKRIRDAIESHRNSADDDVFHAADICISVQEYDPGSRFLRYMFPFFAGAARVKFLVSGTVNGTVISFSSSGNIGAARYIGAFGGSSEAMLESCLRDCIGNVCLLIDNTAGREPPPFARFWGRISLARWIAAAVVLVVFLGLSIALHPAKPGAKAGGEVFAMIFGTALAAAATIGIVSLGGLLMAPSDFLLNHPDGMKIMTRTGVKSPLALRIVATLLLFASCGAAGLSLLILLERR